MDATDQLLLSEGVCRQLGIVQYHEAVSTCQTERCEKNKEDIRIPLMRVRLTGSVCLPPQHSAVVPVKLESPQKMGPMMVESSVQVPGLEVSDTLIMCKEDRQVVTNTTGFTHQLEAETEIGRASEAMIIDSENWEQLLHEEEDLLSECCTVHQVSTTEMLEGSVASWMEKLSELLLGDCVESPVKLRKMLLESHQVFCLDPSERGETDLVQLEINTGNSPPLRQPVRQTPFAVSQEIAQQLELTQKNGIIQPSYFQSLGLMIYLTSWESRGTISRWTSHPVIGK